jgi:hypothetical protein
MSRRILVLLVLLAGAPLVSMGALGQGQTVVSVPATLIGAVDQAAAAGDATALSNAAAAVIAAANGDPAALKAAVAAAVAAADPSQVPSIVAAFVTHGQTYADNGDGQTDLIVTAGVNAKPALAAQIAAAAAGAAPTQAAAITIAAIQALPADQQTQTNAQNIASTVEAAVPGETQQITAALGPIAPTLIANNASAPLAQPPVSPH